jgi:hypothetical protein
LNLQAYFFAEGMVQKGWKMAIIGYAKGEHQ